ncbi:Rha family transcriptional regulator [Escherichia coli]|uniref:Rha family transcriptional regulator n=1 Tax=Escherichia coli TaxID=562 RepID=UPI00201E46DA|nr:Rha family transcriptional regulator [Escherichia coli]
MNYLTIVNGIDFRDLVFVTGNEPVTDTRKVAVAFAKNTKMYCGKQEPLFNNAQKNLQSAILRFAMKTMSLQNGKPQPIYRMTKDGWTMLVFGFTGKAAMTFKEAYIQAFNWMAELIQQGLANLEAERNAVMLEYMKEKDVASMSGRLLNRWGRVKKPQLLARLDRLEQQGQIALPGFDKGISA